MGRIATVLSFKRGVRGNANISAVKVDPGASANIQIDHSGAPGDDSMPLPGDYVAVMPAPGAGRGVGVGYLDPKNEQKAVGGERRFYARNSAGDQVVEIFLRSDGSVRIENANGFLELKSDGEIVANGAKITTGGDFITAAGISLDNHTHKQGVDSGGDNQQDTDEPD